MVYRLLANDCHRGPSGFTAGRAFYQAPPMPQSKRQPVPDGLTVSRRVSLVGVLQRQEAATWVPLDKTHVCHVVLEVGEHDVTVVAYGETAKQLATVFAGSGVQVDGQLIQHRWTVDVNQKRERLEVEADKITALTRRRREMP